MTANGPSEEGSWELDEHQRRQMGELLALIESDEHAPTAVRETVLAADVHVADSLAALELTPVRAASQITDMGTGAGFPGLALAVALPKAEVSLLDSRRRACEFLQRACERAEIENARIVWARVEEWREGVGQSDLVVARALAAQPVVLEYAAPLLRVGGTLVDWRGARDDAEELASQRAGAELSMRPVDVRRVEPFAGAREHHLHVFEKVAPTPERFPRRAGMARKRPLGR